MAIKTCNTGITSIDAFKSSNRSSVDLLNIVMFDWPETVNIIERVERIIRFNAFDNQVNQSIIFDVIKDALKKYENGRLAHLKRFGTLSTSRYRLAAFLDGVVSSACERFQFQVVDCEGKLWAIEQSVPISTPIEKQDTSLLEHTTRSVLYRAITTNEIQAALKEDKYEADILVNGLGICH